MIERAIAARFDIAGSAIVQFDGCAASGLRRPRLVFGIGVSYTGLRIHSIGAAGG